MDVYTVAFSTRPAVSKGMYLHVDCGLEKNRGVGGGDMRWGVERTALEAIERPTPLP